MRDAELSVAERLAAEIRNAAWFVRYYARPTMRAARAKSLVELGMTCRRAFNAGDRAEHFAIVLVAIVDGLTHEERPIELELGGSGRRRVRRPVI